MLYASQRQSADTHAFSFVRCPITRLKVWFLHTVCSGRQQRRARGRKAWVFADTRQGSQVQCGIQVISKNKSSDKSKCVDNCRDHNVIFRIFRFFIDLDRKLVFKTEQRDYAQSTALNTGCRSRTLPALDDSFFDDSTSIFFIFNRPKKTFCFGHFWSKNNAPQKIGL